MSVLPITSSSISDETKSLFNSDKKYFPTFLQQFQFYDKYARFNYEHMRRETWQETVERSVNFLRELSENKLPESVYRKIEHFILTMKVMPSMRLLAMAGPAAQRNHISIYNCFARHTRFITDKGIKRLGDTVGQTVNVRTIDGEFRPAEVRSFGRQALTEIRLRQWTGGKHGNITHIVHATPNHRWILLDGSETTELRVGDKLAAPDLSFDPSHFDPEAVAHGFVFGDGTINRQSSGDYIQARLCGSKRELADTVFVKFNRSYPPSYNGDPVVYFGKDLTHWKAVPETEDPLYVAAFIYGWMLADANTSSSGVIRISSQNHEAVEWLKRSAPLAGYKVLSDRIYTEDTNYGPRSEPLHIVSIGTGEASIFRVEEIRSFGESEVFCVVEPITQTFQLANGQITGNCAFVAIDDLAAFHEALYISMSGGGVGFSVEHQFIDQLPVVEYQKEVSNIPTVTIDDSAEGWAYALEDGLKMWFSGYDVQFDYSQVRPEGTILKTKGGRASGPAPLQEMLDFARKTVLGAQGRRLRSLECHDLMCMIGNAAVSGGVRRTAMISLFDYDDILMITCKTGKFPNYRWNANNSAVWPDDIKDQSIRNQFSVMHDDRTGEPGIFSRANVNRMKSNRRTAYVVGTNPCGEIGLQSQQFCNLSIAVARADDTEETLREKVEVATIIGTIQSMATKFPVLRPQWKENCEAERLLGVDITGQMDAPILREDGVFDSLREHAVATNQKYADILGINQSVSVTCVKPSGNSSVFLNCSSGLHPRWSEYYLKNVTIGTSSPLFKMFKDQGVPMVPYNGQFEDSAHMWLVNVPVKSPDGALTRHDVSAIDQCNWWLKNRLEWTEHQPSVTITYGDDEYDDVVQWVIDHKDFIAGMAFLPKYEASYGRMPIEEITKEQYEECIEKFPEVDFSYLHLYESEDYTTAAMELACSAGACDISF